MLNSILLATTTTETDWSFIWLVTIMGFILVLILLFVFVYIMKGLGGIMQVVENAGKKANNKAVQQPQTVSPKEEGNDDMAAVALALHLYFNGLHDMESPRLTLKAHATQWNRK